MTGQHPATYIMWLLLLIGGAAATFEGSWSVLFIAIATFTLTLIPVLGPGWTGVRLPSGFVAAVVFFITGTLFLGEVGDFYEHFWWWDILLHAGSAIGFGMIGTVFVVIMVRGDRLAVSPRIGALLAFSFAVSIGVLWEIFEYSMDQLFGMNMQKSGLDDTMSDLMVDCVGAGIGAIAGYNYLRGWSDSGLSRTVRVLIDGLLRRPRP